MGMGFYTYDGPIGCKETATAFNFDLLSNKEDIGNSNSFCKRLK
jgi:hypothetical protein